MTSILEEIYTDVKKLSLDQQQDLLGLIRKWLNRKDVRTSPRKAVSIPVKVVSDDQLFESNTKDISTGGTFVKTEHRESFKEDQSINLVFNMPASGRAFKLNGRIVRVENRGIAVQYEDISARVSQDLEAALFEKIA